MHFPITKLALTLVALHLSVTQPIRAASWITNAPLAAARSLHTATVLTNGTVLIAGGEASGTAELYDPATATNVPTGIMKIARYNHTATLLTNGTVLVAGGSDYNHHSLTNAELYNPITGSWTLTGSLHDARVGHTMTLLADGRVLVTGGFYPVGTGGALGSAELYDPASGQWTITGSLCFTRYFHTATRLPGGKVLVAGGLCGSLPPPWAEVAIAELYDPVSGTWSQTGTMNVPRASHQAALLPDGSVLVAAGANYTGMHPMAGAELYDPGSGTWTTVGSLSTARRFHKAALLPNGKLLVMGGLDPDNNPLASAELYNPGSGAWTTAGVLNTARFYHTATLLPNGNVLVAGSETTNYLELASTEVYTSSNVTVSVCRLTEPTAVPGGAFQFTFTNTPDVSFITYGTTDLSLPISNWMVLRGLIEVSPGQYQFTDPQATSGDRRFYRVRSP